MLGQRVGVAFEALPSNADYESVRADVERHLPLRNLHWVRKSAANRTIRTIQTLPLDVRPLDSFRGKTDLLDRPYLHLLFVVCDDNEVYRASIRTQIREWLDTITAKHHQEWLIVHVTSGKGGVAKFYQRKGAIVDKIKADFNTGKRDRCIQVVQGASEQDPTAWAEFLTKVKEGVVATFDSNVGLYEENVRKADSQRQLDGWQYLPFFRQKEALADSFEAMTLYEDALIQYDELEAAFFQNLKEQGQAAWFRNFGGLAAGDDALPLISTDNKPYRKLIDSNSIPIFDFRIYLFARQATMLFHLGRVVEVARRGAYFISTFARKLRENQAALGQNFVESWTYSACLNVVAECEGRIEQDLSDPSSVAFIAVKAELLELAKKQLDKIGMSAGHLPAVHPFSMSFNESAPGSSALSSCAPSASSGMQPPQRSNPPVTRRDLLDGIAKQDVFDKLYVDLAQKTMQAYQSSGRRRCAAKLHAFLAALEHHRERLVNAQKLFSQLPAHYTDLRWTALDAYLLSRCTDLQAALDMPRDQLLSTLALVRAGVEYGSPRWSLDALLDGDDGADLAAQNEKLAKRLMDDVYRLSATLTKDFAAVAFPTFSITLKEGCGERPVDEDGMRATVLVRSVLPCDVRVDEVRLKLATSDGEQVWLTGGACTLPPGDTAVSVFCPTSVTGRLTLELSQLRFSRIIFQYSHRPVSDRNLAPDPRIVPVSPGKQPSIYLSPDHQAVTMYTEEPDAVHLDRERQLIICVDPGRNQVSRITLRFDVFDQDVVFAVSRSACLDKGVRMTSDGDESLVLEGLKPFEIVKVCVPLSGQIINPVVEFSTSAEYTTAKRPQTRRTFRRTSTYSVALPLAVNVQDYFRERSLLSKFSVTSDGIHGLKVKSACISAPSQVTVKPCRLEGHAPVVISPLQTANFLFKIACEDPASVSDPLRLVLTYSSIEHRLRIRVSVTARAKLSTPDLIPHRRWILSALIAESLSLTNLDEYCAKESLEHLGYDELAWIKRCEMCLVQREKRNAVLAAIQDIYGDLRAAPSGDALDCWRTLEIPLDLPALNVLNLVRIQPALSRTEVGQAIPATLTIRSVFRWRRDASEEPVRLRYAVVANTGEWVVSGRAKREFVADDDVELSVPLVLVPLRPTALFLPSVAIHTVRSARSGVSSQITCETQHVTAATTVEVLPITHRTTFEISVQA
ncbi:transport protein particle complex II subunit TRS130 [Rhodotorula paludigena]|uniref:transport protein particle complex II subunit TRS130 n=1 Tax=Rhodotorula paludigena TaxID=86838 RepID=UPI003181C26E